MTKDNDKITHFNADLNTKKKIDSVLKEPATNSVSLLQEAIREVRVASAERAESAADIAELNRLKLEMLAEELNETFEESARYHDLFDCAMSSVPTPRLFIDAISHVIMARDQKTYRFVRNTRQGRVILEESAEISVVSDAITHYMAERIVEHQTLLDQPALNENATPKTALVDKEAAKKAAKRDEKEGPWADFLLGLVWFVVGVITTSALIYLWTNGYLDSIIISDAVPTTSE